MNRAMATLLPPSPPPPPSSTTKVNQPSNRLSNRMTPSVVASLSPFFRPLNGRKDRRNRPPPKQSSVHTLQSHNRRDYSLIPTISAQRMERIRNPRNPSIPSLIGKPFGTRLAHSLTT